MTEKAAAWIARLDAGDLTADELIEFREWATASAAHMRELERLADTWESLDALAALRPMVAMPDTSPRRAIRNIAIAASAAAIAVTMWLFSPGADPVEPVVLAETYVTDVGEQRSVEPGEGSTISLNTDSRLSLEYSASQRLVRLAKGEAFFEVSSNDHRPFIVETRLGNVVVTGTAFLVRVEAAELQVLVREGHVELHKQVEGSVPVDSAVTALNAGEVAVIDSVGSHVEMIGPVRMVRKLGWRDGMLMFDGESLDEVVHEVGRYTSVQIIIDDPELRDLRVGGYFRVGELEDLLGTLQSDFDVQVNRVADDEIRLTKGDN